MKRMGASSRLQTPKIDGRETVGGGAAAAADDAAAGRAR